jgi:hypothetical protein
MNKFKLTLFEIVGETEVVVEAKDSMEAKRIAGAIPKKELTFRPSKYRYVAMDAQPLVQN